MVEFQTGDILEHVHGARWIRIGHPHPNGPKSIWVHSCTIEGTLTGSTGRYLLATTIASRYIPSSRPTQEVYR